ncbi:hypothetical protein NECAME_14008, partial [Necator americanus]
MSSSSDSDDSDCDDIPLRLGSSHIYFVHNGDVCSMYKCLLRPGETTVSISMFARPVDCAIFLLAGGHFAAAIFKNDKMVAHKAFHRYVVRAKQGGAQTANDKAKGPARSAGAALRRTIPFETKRPLIDEVRRVWERLSSVTIHGALDEFMEERSRRKQRMKILAKKKRTDDKLWNPDDDKKEDEVPSKEKKSDHLKPVAPVQEKPKDVDKWPSLDKNARRELYNAKLALKGRPPLSEDEFEELREEERKADDAMSSSSDSNDSDCDDIPLRLGSSHIYFVHNGDVCSMYKCLLRHGETTVSISMFARPVDCAIFLLAGGHFAAAIFKNDKMVAHKTFHRYVVRAKQGGAQTANDKAKGPARSAGAALRRYNER